MADFFKILEKNPNDLGRDFFVGDLHGCINLLDNKLAQARFDPQIDRVISVGDLGDRGNHSQKCIELIKQPWFHAVRGNHEDMCLMFYRGELESKFFIENGGEWFTKLSENEQNAVVDLIETLPLILEVATTNGLRVGVLHGDAIEPHWDNYKNGQFSTDSVLWGRRKFLSKNERCVEGIDLIIVGHTPCHNPTKLGNVLYIDTGAVYSYYRHNLTLVEDVDLLNIN
jgi:serine/threonine protein phosphatase 1